jgi:hypothetical protein
VLPHDPVFEQRACGSAVGDTVPTAEHVPAPFRLHAWQVEQPLVEQQTPSMQLPLAHSLPPPQDTPRPFFAVHVVPEQKLPPTQSLSLAQLVLHALFAPQTYGPQSIGLVWLQEPVPEQNDGGWRVEPLHEAAVPHAFEVGCCSHAPLTQKPVLPHPLLAAQPPCGSVVLFATLAQVPLPLTLHAWQVEQVAVVQQTPSVQWPLMHWLSPPQLAPFAFFELHVPAVVELPVQ